jgi:beta-carotene/zeaxanthin 4-ketolase
MNLSLPTSNPVTASRLDPRDPRWQGVAIALGIISTWAVSLGILLNLQDAAQIPWQWKFLAIGIQTFLYTGLFITAHDAMHGVISTHPPIDNFIGKFTLLVYGLFSYDRLLKAHWQHHHHPASDLDPDFHNGKFTGAIAWYFYFMARYWNWWRFLGLVTSFHVMHLAFGVSETNLVLFWIAPSLLSSVQLFYFGTYLPHRTPTEGYADATRASSAYRPLWWSFLSCYHFGYHHEHHLFPAVPWYKLPAIATQAQIEAQIKSPFKAVPDLPFEDSLPRP